MREEVRRLGSLTAIQYLLDLNGLQNGETIESLQTAATGHLTKPVFRITLEMLDTMGYVMVSEGKARKMKAFDKSTFIIDFITYLNQIQVLPRFFHPSNLKLDSESNQYYLFCNTISLELSPYRNFLIEAEFLLQDSSRLKLFITHEFKEFTETFIFPLVENWRKTGRQSPEALKKQNEAREKAGLDAELFVMNYEKQRLSTHPRVNNVQHVALYDVSAGFDILSFSTNQSFILDREIEVKSYIGSPHFFLSRTEYNRAKENKSGYFIYLVDRARMSEIDYRPVIIENPYDSLENSEEWDAEYDGYHYTKSNRHEGGNL